MMKARVRMQSRLEMATTMRTKMGTKVKITITRGCEQLVHHRERTSGSRGQEVEGEEELACFEITDPLQERRTGEACSDDKELAMNTLLRQDQTQELLPRRPWMN